MADLTAAESGVFEFGEQIEVPPQIRGGGFCFHQAVWFVSGRIPDTPIWPRWIAEIRSFLIGAVYLRWVPLFETSDEDNVRPLGDLYALDAGVYLIQLLDSTNRTGHWVVLDTATGVFDPGTGRKSIQLADWMRYLENRLRIRRVLRIQTALCD